jgi:hypothetical protein
MHYICSLSLPLALSTSLPLLPFPSPRISLFHGYSCLLEPEMLPCNLVFLRQSSHSITQAGLEFHIEPRLTLNS